MFFTPERIRRLSLALIVGLACALIVSFKVSPREGSFFTGDFPSFYSAGVIIRSDRAPDLYDQTLQHSVQNQFFPELGDRYLSFAYPPYVAYLFAPLTLLPPATAKVFYVFFLFSTFVGALRTLGAIRPQVASLPAAACCLAFFPLLGSIIAGQNSAISLFLFASALSCFHAKRDGPAGIALGLWLFKPHFALIAIALSLFTGRFRPALFALIPAAFYFILPLADFGIEWPRIWLRAAWEFAAEDLRMNGFQAISFRDFFGALQVSGGVAAVFSVALLGATAWIIFTARSVQALALIGPAVLLSAPHALYYDATLVVVPVLLGSCLSSRRDLWEIVLLLIGANIFCLSREFFVAQPLVALVLWVWWRGLRNSETVDLS